ncbi:MAG: hypothetical protein FP818_10535 [Rhodocyclaceae bacterium]|nr:hypothetical protein [Rhodocyclaceae bacterium]
MQFIQYYRISTLRACAHTREVFEMCKQIAQVHF